MDNSSARRPQLPFFILRFRFSDDHFTGDPHAFFHGFFAPKSRSIWTISFIYAWFWMPAIAKNTRSSVKKTACLTQNTRDMIHNIRNANHPILPFLVTVELLTVECWMQTSRWKISVQQFNNKKNKRPVTLGNAIFRALNNKIKY